MKKSAAVTSVSGALAEVTYQLAGRRPQVIYNGVDPSFSAPTKSERLQARARLGVAETSRVIVFVGRCEADKGIGDLQTALLGISQETAGLVLLVVGDGSRLSTLKEQGRGNPGAASMILVGAVAHSEIKRYLHAADVFALPSYSEGMPNALLEAMACGLACVATRVGGIPEVIEDGRNGLLVPARSTVQLRQAIARLLGDNGLRARLGAEAAATIKRRFSWRQNAADYLSVYQRVVSS